MTTGLLELSSIAQLPTQVFLPEEQTFNARDTMLYALGLGIGREPADPVALTYVYERQLQGLPTQYATLASSSAWMRHPNNRITWSRLVALSHSIQVLQPIATHGCVRSQLRVATVSDRGPSKGALIHWVRELFDANTDRKLALINGIALARADGGFGGIASPRRPEPWQAQRPYDHAQAVATSPDQALLYRLSGDLNPIHADPELASTNGMSRPILHGLCLLGMACFQIVKIACANNPALVRSFSGRYTGFFYPGETLHVCMWFEGTTVRFQCIAQERNEVILRDGLAVLCEPM